MKKTKLHKITKTLSVHNMREFCKKNNLSENSYYSAKKRAKADNQKLFLWEGYLAYT